MLFSAAGGILVSSDKEVSHGNEEEILDHVAESVQLAVRSLRADPAVSRPDAAAAHGRFREPAESRRRRGSRGCQAN
ncbi:hypothetical protein AGR2A_Cc120040 [Agrobacterium genomosp. 2 str. CFBP 5494]|uniref:Uncharacterized protein n=1 Tax=Agrobacterium genomosp. 2 str. CFBP 5494 TaxID=1183436 RepID=A0A9W5EZ42_9HYPH|nr:hypothetical protein AGR2A_Cc120040 [Agrobacterium genomosp. 2 str. CFBP 5494]